MDYSPPGSSVHGIFQARILEWVAISFFKVSSWPRDQTQVSYIAGRFFTKWATSQMLYPVQILILHTHHHWVYRFPKHLAESLQLTAKSHDVSSLTPVHPVCLLAALVIPWSTSLLSFAISLSGPFLSLPLSANCLSDCSLYYQIWSPILIPAKKAQTLPPCPDSQSRETAVIISPGTIIKTYDDTSIE